MLQAAVDAQDMLVNLSRSALMADKKTQLAVTMCLRRIGEQAVRVLAVAPHFADDHPGIAWINIRGMRNQIAHNYENVDLDIVWQTAQAFLPDLIFELRKLSAGLE